MVVSIEEFRSENNKKNFPEFQKALIKAMEEIFFEFNANRKCTYTEHDVQNALRRYFRNCLYKPGTFNYF